MFTFVQNIYQALVTLPDKLYPFASEIEGRLVRGQRSYMAAIERAFDTYGPGRFGYKLLIYRGTFHLLGSVLFIIAATLLSHTLFGSDVALYVLLFAAIAALSFQEFYLHPKKYGQRTQKGVADWFTWTMPMLFYLLLFVL